MIKTFYDFVNDARGKTRDEIYDLFEFNTDAVVRDAIMGMASPNDPEPVRTGLHLLGTAYGVWELTDY